MLILAVALSMIFNVIILRYKWSQERYYDFFFDLFLLVVLSSIFGHGVTGMSIASVSSAVLSIYLYFFPPNPDFSWITGEDKAKQWYED